MSDSLIKVDGLTKIYKLYDSFYDRIKESISPSRNKYHKNHFALNNISFCVKPGETVGIVGTNGSGKSTLLKILAGISSNTAGNVRVDGRVAALLELGAGFHPELTGVENVLFNGVLLGYTRSEIQARLDEILSFADIGEYAFQPVKTYSSGMFVRLAFATAISVDPDILIVDEALSVGDEAFQRKCFAKIHDFKVRGKTILFVSHALNTILELCDRAFLMHGGRLLLDGKPKKVVSYYHKLIAASHDCQGDIITEIETVAHELSISLPDKSADTDDINPYFDVMLIPCSTVFYESRGAIIESLAIKTLDGEQVNVLVRGQDYIFSYNVKFCCDASKVRFGMLIKTVSGIELGGMISHPQYQYYGPVIAGTVASANFIFKCSFLPGTYFVNAGVSGILDQHDSGDIYLHRIIDAMMFRVMTEIDLLSTGIIDISSSCSPPRIDRLMAD